MKPTTKTIILFILLLILIGVTIILSKRNTEPEIINLKEVKVVYKDKIIEVAKYVYKTKTETLIDTLEVLIPSTDTIYVTIRDTIFRELTAAYLKLPILEAHIDTLDMVIEQQDEVLTIEKRKKWIYGGVGVGIGVIFGMVIK